MTGKITIHFRLLFVAGSERSERFLGEQKGIFIYAPAHSNTPWVRQADGGVT